MPGHLFQLPPQARQRERHGEGPQCLTIPASWGREPGYRSWGPGRRAPRAPQGLEARRSPGWSWDRDRERARRGNRHRRPYGRNPPRRAHDCSPWDPLDQVFPRQNAALQDQIMRDQLAVSQFPAGNPIQRKNFPLRNRTMALISDATGHDHNGKYHGHPPMARPARSRGGTRMHLPGCTRSRVPTGPGRCDSSPWWQSPQVNAIPTATRAPARIPHNARDLADPDLRRRRSVIRRIPAGRYRVRGGNRIAWLVYGAKGRSRRITGPPTPWSTT